MQFELLTEKMLPMNFSTLKTNNHTRLWPTPAKLLAVLFAAILLVQGGYAFAQQSNLTPNVPTPLTSDVFPGLTVSSDFSNKDNAIDPDLSKRANRSVLIGSGGYLEIKDDNATGSEVFPAGSFVGFNVGSSGVLGLGNIVIKTYLGNTQQESMTGENLTLLGSSNEPMFKTTKTFDKIRVEFTGLSIGVTNYVYYAFIQKVEAGPTLACNTNTMLSYPTYPIEINNSQTGAFGLNLLGGVTNAQNVIDGDPNTYASMSVEVGIAGGAQLSVIDEATEYPAGTFAGFDISSSDLLSISLADNIEVQTYLNGSHKETKSSGGLVADVGLLSGSDRHILGFVTSEPFDEVRLVINSGILGVNLGSTSVYGLVLKRFCEGGTLPANTNQKITNPDWPVFVENHKSGVIGVGLGNNVTNLDHILIDDTTKYASIADPLLSVGNQVEISVKKELNPFPANTFAGFDIETMGVADVSVMGAMTVSLYRNGVLVDELTGSNLASAGVPLLSGSGRMTIGMLSPDEFDEVKLTVDYGVLGVGVLDEVRVHGMVMKRFELGEPLECNTPTFLSNPGYPVYIDGKNTGITGGIAAGTINNGEAAIDNDPNTAATIVFVAQALSTATFTIADALTTYQPNTFAAIEMRLATLLDVDVLQNFNIHLLKDGNIVQTSVPNSLLLGVNTSLLTSDNKLILGVVAEEEFNAIMLEVENPVSADLGVVEIYGAMFEELCEVDLVCNQSTMLQFGKHPVIINNQRTGVLGVADIGSDVKNPYNVLDEDNTKYAELVSAVGAVSDASLSVWNPLQEYPTGTFAGFVVQNNDGLIDLDLLNSITVSTYNNGVLQESRSGASLLELTLLINLIGPGSGTRNMGFITSKPFDEIQISLGKTVSVGVVTTVRVYGAFVDTRTSIGIGGGSLCLSTAPDFAVTYINTEVEGDVSTNDHIPSTATYGTPTPGANNPNGDVLNMNSDGTYTFTPTDTGKYVFYVPVCLDGQTTDCAIERLTITVLDKENINPPVVNDDIATMVNSSSSSSVSIPVRANDKPGNSQGNLSHPIVTNTGDGSPAHGTVSVGSNGQVIYTPHEDFTGVDSFSYTICENPSGLCESAIVTVYVLPDAPGVNTTLAVDDYATAQKNTTLEVPAAQGLLANDMDPEGDIQEVIPSSINIAGKGSIEILADGSYTFTPETDYVGPVSFEYTVIDNGEPEASSTGTLHILVTPEQLVWDDVDLMVRIRVLPNVLVKVEDEDLTAIISVSEMKGGTTDGSPIIVTIPDVSRYEFKPYNPTRQSVGFDAVNNSEWTYLGHFTGLHYFSYGGVDAKTVIDGRGGSSFAIDLVYKTLANDGRLSMSASISEESGGDSFEFNNFDITYINFTQPDEE